MPIKWLLKNNPLHLSGWLQTLYLLLPCAGITVCTPHSGANSASKGKINFQPKWFPEATHCTATGMWLAQGKWWEEVAGDSGRSKTIPLLSTAARTSVRLKQQCNDSLSHFVRRREAAFRHTGFFFKISIADHLFATRKALSYDRSWKKQHIKKISQVCSVGDLSEFIELKS